MHYGKDADANSLQSSPPSISDNMFDGLTDTLETSLMQNDLLNRHRNPPILYLQNRVSSAGGDLPPKMVNNPSGDTTARHERTAIPHHSQSAHLTKAKKAKELGFLGHLAILGKRAFGSKFDDKHKHDENQPPIRRMENGVLYESVGQNNPLFEPPQGVETEIQMTQSGPVVRPTSLPQGNENSRRLCEHDMALDEVKMGENDTHNDSPVFSRLRGAPYSKSTSDLSPQKSSSSSRFEKDTRLSRPSTLSLKGHNYRYSNREPSNSLSSLPFFKNSVLRGSGSHRTLSNGYKLIKPPYPEPEPTEKIKARVKTPLLEKKGRLSLYDDRLMSDVKQKDYTETSDKKNKPNMTLQQFKGIEKTSNQLQSADCTC